MKITFTPQLRAGALFLSVNGDVLTVNGTDYDFSRLDEGDALPPEAVDCPLLASGVTRAGRRIALTLILPHGSDAPLAARFPSAIIAADGVVPLPLQYPTEDEVAE